MMSHLILLSVGTIDAEDHARTYQDLTELSRSLAVSHDYVSVSSQLVGRDDEAEESVVCDREHLTSTEETLFKVRRVMIEHGVSPESVEDLIIELGNTGILFRERTGD